MTEDNHIKDLEFNISKKMTDPFKGTLKFTVKKEMKITYFEFSTHDMGCCRTVSWDIKYGLKLKLKKKTLFTYHKQKVDVDVNLILSPGNTYTLDTWLSGHNKLKSGKYMEPCYYHYAEVLRSDNINYEPFEFIYPDDETANTTCIYVISYEAIE